MQHTLLYYLYNAQPRHLLLTITINDTACDILPHNKVLLICPPWFTYSCTSKDRKHKIISKRWCHGSQLSTQKSKAKATWYTKQNSTYSMWKNNLITWNKLIKNMIQYHKVKIENFIKLFQCRASECITTCCTATHLRILFNSMPHQH